MTRSYTLFITGAVTLIGIVVFALFSRPNDGLTPIEVRGEKTSSAPNEKPPALEITQARSDVDSQSTPEATPESSKTIVQMTFDGEIVELDVREAPLSQVLETFQVHVGLEIEDLTPQKDRELTETPLSFQFTGSLHDAIRFVLTQHDYNYALAFEPAATGNNREPTLEKLYLLGPQQEPDEIPIDPSLSTELASGQPPGVSAESGRVAGETTASASRETASTATRLSDMLRARALQSSRTVPVPTDHSPPKVSAATAGADSASASAAANAASGPSEADEPSSNPQSLDEQLAIMTRRANAQVKALAESLKQAERDLKQAAQ